jgi:hypothetical protein
LPAWVEHIYLVATSSILPHLKAYLPHASTELYVVEISPAPNYTELATFPLTKSPPESSAWTVGGLGITGILETEFLFMVLGGSSWTINRYGDEKRHFVRRTPRYYSLVVVEKETLMVGSPLQHRLIYPDFL